jgi:hypothetical protein
MLKHGRHLRKIDPDPQNLIVRTYLNDFEVCKAHTSETLFTIRHFMTSLSRAFRSSRATSWRPARPRVVAHARRTIRRQ